MPEELPGGWAPLLRSMTARHPGDRPYAVSVASRLGAPREVLRTLAMPSAAVAGAVPATPGAPQPGTRDATRPLTSGAPPAASAYAATGVSAAAVPWWQRPAAAITGLLVVAALLMGMALRSDTPVIPEAVATMSPAAVPATTTPPPPPPADQEDDDKDDEDKDEGKARGKGKKD